MAGLRSAEGHGTLLAADLKRAFVEDETMLAVCVDQSKAYDNPRLDLLGCLLAGSSVPTEVWRPIANMAAAPRRLRVLAAVGDHQWLSAGLPDSHEDPEPRSGEVGAVRQQRLPWRHAPLLGG